MRTPVAPALLVLVLLTGGCSDDPGNDPDPTGASQSTAPTGTGPADPGAGTPTFAADTRPDDGGHGSGNGLGLVGVRTSRHAGFDRVVFDLDGTGVPGWRVSYTDRPVADGSGEPVALEGTVYLQVVLRGLGLPYDTGVEPFGGPDTRVRGSGTEGVTEVAPGGVFEGEQVAHIGLTGTQRPFRAFALADPVRVVVDVAHE